MKDRGAKRTDPPRGSLIPGGAAPSIELRLRPNTSLIALVRCFVSDFYGSVVPDSFVAHRLALVAHEMLENTAKYSSDGEAALLVRCDPVRGTVSVRTSNRASPSRIEELRQAFAAIEAAPNASAFYMQALRRTAVKKSGSGGLGLARIWAEGDMRLSLTVKGDCVEIGADGKMEGR